MSTNHPIARSIIDAVMKQGGDPAPHIEALVERRPPEVLVSGQMLLCLAPDCSFKEPYNGHDLDTCPLCGYRVARFYNEQSEDENSDSLNEYLVPDEGQKISGHRLSHLRPGDKFLFTGPLPFKTVTHTTEYVISPAPRGFIRFSDPSSRVYKIRLEHGFVFPVVLCSGSSGTDTRRFHRGDRVIHKVLNYVAVVHRVDGDLCKVVIDGESALRPVPSSLLDLTQKDETTRAYITRKDGKFLVRFADFLKVEDSLLDALRVLQKEHRTAFYRYSKMLSMDPDGYGLSTKDVEYLMDKDPKIWDPEKQS